MNTSYLNFFLSFPRPLSLLTTLLSIVVVNAGFSQKSSTAKPINNIKALGKIDFDGELKQLNKALADYHPYGSKRKVLPVDSLVPLLKSATSITAWEEILIGSLYAHGWERVTIKRTDKILKTERLFPVTITQVSEHLVVNQSGYASLASGDALISINKKPIKDWIDQYLIQRYGNVYPADSYPLALENFHAWIGELAGGDSLQVMAIDFFSRDFKKIKLAYYQKHSWMDSMRILQSHTLKMSSGNLEAYSGEEKIYHDLSSSSPSFPTAEETNAMHILDLRKSHTLDYNVFQYWVKNIVPDGTPNFSISYGSKSSTVKLSDESISTGLEQTRISVENIKMLIGQNTGALATLLAAMCMDANENCLVGEQTIAPYEGGYIEANKEIRLFKDALLIQIPIAKIEYLEEKYPLRDRGLIPESIIQQSWEDLMLGEDTLLNSIFEE